MQINYKDLRAKKEQSALEILARRNTWSHQRRKKREQESQQADQHNKKESDIGILENVAKDGDRTNEDYSDKTPLKRKCEFETESDDSKRLKSGDQHGLENPDADSKQDVNTSEDDPLDDSGNSDPPVDSSLHKSEKNQEPCILKSVVSVKKIDSEIQIEMGWLDGLAGRDALHQVMQYIKNNLKFD